MKRKPIHEAWQLSARLMCQAKQFLDNPPWIRQVLGSLGDAHVAACPKPARLS